MDSKYVLRSCDSPYIPVFMYNVYWEYSIPGSNDVLKGRQWRLDDKGISNWNRVNDDAQGEYLFIVV